MTYILIVEFVCHHRGCQFRVSGSLLRCSPLQNTPVFKIVPGCNRGAVAPAYENKTRMARINLDITLDSFDIKKRRFRIAGYLQTLQGSFGGRRLVQVSPSPVYVLIV